MHRPVEIRQARPEAPETPLSTEGGPGPGFLTFEDLLRAVKRRRLLIASIASLILAAALVQSATMTPVYTSSGTVLINKFELRTDVVVRSDESDTPGFDLSPFASILRDADLFREVAERLELEQDKSFQAEISKGLLVDAFKGVRGALQRSELSAGDGDGFAALHRRFVKRSRLKVKNHQQTIKIGYTSVAPDAALRVLRVVLDIFVERSDEVNRHLAGRTEQRLRNQLELQRETVSLAEQDLLDYAAKHSLDIGASGVPQSREFDALFKELTGSRASVAEAQARQVAARDAAPGELPPELATPAIRGLQKKLSDLKTQHAVVSESFGPRWPRAKELDLEITEVESQLSNMISQAIEAVDEEYSYALNRHQRLMDAVSAMREDTTEAGRELIEFGILKKHADAEKTLYADLMKQLQRARMAALEPSGVRIISPPTLPVAATPPTPMHVLGISVFIAVGLALGAAVLMEAVSNRVGSQQEIEQLTGLPVLALIPRLPGGQASRRRSGRAKRPLQVVLPDEGAGTPPALAVAREAYRTLHTSLQPGDSSSAEGQVILVTSPGPDEGKTTTSINLSISFAETGSRTLLIDLDLRNGGVGEALDLRTDASAKSLLSGKTDLAGTIAATPYPNLFVVSSGAPAANAYALVRSGLLAATIQEARDHYDFIIIDTPPVLGLADSMTIAGLADVVLIVARCRRTAGQALQRACALLFRSGASIAGIVLNDVRRTDRDEHDVYAYEQYYPDVVETAVQNEPAPAQNRSAKLHRAR